MCDWAVGSDTGGSIRIPASFCGVVGFKPTIGAVDTTGVFPLSRTLDTMGPLAPDVRSAARALEMMSELTQLVPPAPRPFRELRLAVPRGWGEDLHPEIAVAWSRVSAGLPQIEFPDRRWMAESGAAILDLEAVSVHRRWLEECPETYGDDVLERLRRAMGTSRRDYLRALLEQSRIRVQAEAAMDGWAALLAPVTRIPAPRIGEYHDRADLTSYTRPFNATGQPVITLPAPVDGLPIGIQAVGHFAQEAGLVEAALALEEAWRSL
jgi:aspartyl-tRNA(Asn)/glutamyl-tRNA(Gln) amidotransferase subunit A